MSVCIFHLETLLSSNVITEEGLSNREGEEMGGEEAEREEDRGGKVREVEAGDAGQRAEMQLTCSHF